MSKITGKFQLTLPKRLVETYGLKVGDEVDLVPAGDCISLIPASRARTAVEDIEERLQYFDRATERQRIRNRERGLKSAKDRGWTRDEIYRDARTR